MPKVLDIRHRGIRSRLGFGSAMARDKDGEVNQTERALRWLLLHAGGALTIIVIFGLIIGVADWRSGVNFFVWSYLLGVGAWLVGGLLGLLFGLPSVVDVKITDAANQADRERPTGGSVGYRESTNLEQVADWVTKILIGLVATQYYVWQSALERAFKLATDMMIPRAGDTAAPAAIIAIAFCTNGFLMAYLLMRRYFITEMVAGQRDASDKLRQFLKTKRDAGLLQRTSVTIDPVGQSSDAKSIAAIAADLAPQESASAAREIAEAVTGEIDFPDDPWRGKFGGQASQADCTLAASVTPVEGAGEWFNIRLSITTTDPALRAGQTATCYLHPTFGPEPKKVAFGPDGVAAFDLVAYGAFTVGVLLEDGARLELNLATIPNAPELFRMR